MRFPLRPLASSLLVVLFASHAGAAAPPSGWTSRTEGGVTVMRPAESGVELRLHAPESGDEYENFGEWFDERSQREPAGVDDFDVGEPNASRGDLRIAAGTGMRAGRKVIVIAIGCERRDGRMQYAELITAPDAALVSRYADRAGEILAARCLEVAGAAEPETTPDAPRAPTAKSEPAPRTPSAKSAPPSVPAPSPGATRGPTGQGLANADITGVLYSWKQVYEVGGLQYKEWTYLLLRDGGVRRDVPGAPPADFDASADRAADPKRWGRWRKAAAGYELSFGGEWTKPPGQLMRQPGRTGERLAGRYEMSSSFSIGTTAAAWSNWGLQLSADGRFRRWRTSGAGGSTGEGDARVSTGMAADDKGSASSVVAPNMGGGSARRTGVTDADLSGTYHVDGWSMELRYDNGKVQRGFFFTDDTRKNLWFEGAELTKRDVK